MELAEVLIHRIIRRKSENPVTLGPIDEGKIIGILNKANLSLFGQEKYKTPFQKAACILEGIARVHPFTDGNKRTVYYSAFAYLQSKGLDLDVRLAESSYIVYVASVKELITEEEIDMLVNEIADWLEHKTKK